MRVNLSLNIQTELDPPSAAVSLDVDGKPLGVREDIHPQDWGEVLSSITEVVGPEMGSKLIEALRTEVTRIMTQQQSQIDSTDALQTHRRQTLAAFQEAAAMLQSPEPPPSA